jgi:Tfp pilus assembly protein PilZ
MVAQVKAIRKYNTAILKLFEIILGLNEGQQQLLLKLTENLFTKEKRANNRKSCHIPIYYATSDRVYSSHIENISPTGLFIKSEKPLPTGEKILMTFNIKGFNKPLKVSGEIAHATDAGIGVKFKDLSPHVANKLENVVVQMRD